MELTKRQQYDSAIKTFTSWLNWSDPVNGGLLMGLGDYYAEIRLLEDELGIPEVERFKVAR